MMQYHFELINLGYAAYATFYDICRQAFPDITDQTIARMVSAIDLLVLRPDEELKRLAHLALELGVAAAVEGRGGRRRALRSALADTDAGLQWLADFDETKNPWFCFSNGNGLYHHVRSWIDDTSLPIAAIGAYVRQLEAGEDISRPTAAVLQDRERVTDGHRALLAEEATANLRRGPGARPHGLRVHRGSQLLHRAPLLHALLEQGARVRCPARGGGVSGRNGGRVLPAPRRGARGSRGAPPPLERRRRRRRTRPRLLATSRRAAEGDLRGDARVGTASGSRAGSRDDRRSGHDHAVGGHGRAHPGMACRFDGR